MPKESKGQGKLDIFKYRNTIEARLNEGYSLKPIYKELEDELAISYRQFLRLTKEYILNNEKVNQKQKSKPSQVKRNPSTSKTIKKPKPTGFYHNPTMDDERLKEIFGE
ncbi:MAG: hypothetical protein V7735_23395 [Photobacterium frigidiphilum]|uniref:hypothetical protein n=1 Tax=Photobacterium frigidiphilum TaxID=264736 RepID=UPI0030016CB7